jgi:hypothetical protein
VSHYGATFLIGSQDSPPRKRRGGNSARSRSLSKLSMLTSIPFILLCLNSGVKQFAIRGVQGASKEWTPYTAMVGKTPSSLPSRAGEEPLGCLSEPLTLHSARATQTTKSENSADSENSTIATVQDVPNVTDEGLIRSLRSHPTPSI